MFSQIDKQLFRAFKEYQIEPRLARVTGRVMRNVGPKIAVIGNCQAFGVAHAMKLLDPSASVHHYSAIGRSKADMALFARAMNAYDHVFTHPFPQGHIKGGDSDELARLVPKAVTFPAVTFAAFHPDLVYLLDKTRGDAQLFGPLGPYQSALAVFAFRAGLSLEEANALFNRNVYETVGYFDVWDAAATELLAYGRNFGMDLSNEILSWARRGVFMYSAVHPRSFVLFDIARKLFERVGLESRSVDFDYMTIHDLARSEIFPIYPPIGELYGVRGDYLFKLGHYHLSDGVGDFLTLPQYLAASYKIYAGAQESQMRHPRIDNWLGDDGARERIVSLARDNLRAGLTPTI